MKKNWQQDMPSTQAYWIGRVLFDIHHKPDDLARYLADSEGYLSSFPLNQKMLRAIRDNDIGEMYLAGVNPYLLRAHCIGLKIPEPVFVSSLAAVAGEARNG